MNFYVGGAKLKIDPWGFSTKHIGNDPTFQVVIQRPQISPFNGYQKNKELGVTEILRIFIAGVTVIQNASIKNAL